MAFTISRPDLAGERGKIGAVIALPDTINLSQLFAGTPQYYPGSVIQIQEVLSIQTSLYDDTVVDVDYTWWDNHLYLGTWQITQGAAGIAIRDGDEGYLTNLSYELSRYSEYTIVADPAIAVAQHEQITLSNCNYYTTPEVFLFPGNPAPVPGSKLYDLNPTFVGDITISKAPLKDTPFQPRIKGVGLCLKPGVELVSLTYTAAVINDIYTDYAPAAVPTCQFLGASCQAQYAAGVAANQIFETQEQCQNTVDSECFPATWVCPTDPTVTFPTWRPNPN
jgi:hypothetical protein